MTHNPGVLTDGLLVIALLLALWGGWRQGAFASVLSTIGVVFGLICGAGLAPKIMGLTDSTALRFLLGLGTVVLLVGMGNLVGGLLGAGVRDNMRLKSAQRIDSTIGAVFQALATLIVAWLVAIPPKVCGNPTFWGSWIISPPASWGNRLRKSRPCSTKVGCHRSFRRLKTTSPVKSKRPPSKWTTLP